VAQQGRALMKRSSRDHGRLLGRGRQQITECRLARVRGLEDHVRRHGEQALMQLTTKSIHDRQYGNERRNTQQHPKREASATNRVKRRWPPPSVKRRIKSQESGIGLAVGSGALERDPASFSDRPDSGHTA
jgi:hypothetical protein